LEEVAVNNSAFNSTFRPEGGGFSASAGPTLADFGQNSGACLPLSAEDAPEVADPALLIDKELKHVENQRGRRIWLTETEPAQPVDHSNKQNEPTRWELDIFLHTLYNVNDNLRLHMTISGGLMAACIGMLNVFEPGHSSTVESFVNDIDRYVFIPAMLSMVISYIGLQHHWNYKKRKSHGPDQMEELYALVTFKYRMLHLASVFLLISAILLGYFLVTEFG
jgi:hypothetical protein